MSHQVINVADVRGNFFGGLPYNVNWSFNGGETPSTLTINVVNEAGVYTKPTLSFAPQSIKIGNFTFRGYLTEYNIKNSASQRTLELKYTDQSLDLDRWFVALNSKHRRKNSGLPLNRVIFVGKEYHPCDTNLDSTVSYSESNIRVIDNCDPCPYMPEDKYDKSCDPILSDFEIFDVYYTFNELIGKMPQGLNFKLNASKYKFFKAQHTGTLRSVLSSWCSDLGLSFFWDPVSNILEFIDRKKPIKIPNKPTDIRLIELTEGESNINTFSRGFIGSFEKAGEIKDYNCTFESKETLKCLTMNDLFAKQRSTALSNPEAPKDADIKELTAAISYLGKEARTAFLWFWFYQNTDAAQTRRLITQASTRGSNDSSNSKIMKYLGNMKILDVYSQTGGNQESVRKFLQLKEQLTTVDKERFENEDKKRGRGPDDPSYYFILAEVDEELAERQLQADINLARNFLGKFFYKKYKAPIPGATNKNSQVSVETPEGEGSAQWYPVDEDLTTLPIFGFGHEPGSVIGRIVKNINSDIKDNQRIEQQARNASQTFNKSKDVLRNINSFILFERNSKWHIPGGASGNGEDALQWYDTLFQWYKDISPQIFGNTEGRPEYLKKIAPEVNENSNVKLFIVRDLKGTKDPDFEIKFNEVPHPDEPKLRKQKTETEEDVFGNTFVINKGSWGLADNTCIRITMPGITFFPPAQAFSNNKFFKEKSDGNAGYIVYSVSSADFKKFIPKQTLFYSSNAESFNVAKIDYHIKQITEDNLSLLNNRRCLINQADFDKYTKNIAQFSAYSSIEPSKTLTFKVAGLYPLNYKVSEGLNSVSIEVSDNGVFTTYSFQDLIIQPPSDDFVDQYLRDSLLPKSSVGYLSPYSNQMISQISNSVRR